MTPRRRGIAFELRLGMKTRSAERQTQRLLRWIFRRGDQMLVCRVDGRGDRTFTLSLVPHANVRAGIAETFTSAWSAFRRHAMIASELRRAGWTLAAYTAD
jgi:hypothetical protein